MSKPGRGGGEDEVGGGGGPLGGEVGPGGEEPPEEESRYNHQIRSMYTIINYRIDVQRY